MYTLEDLFEGRCVIHIHSNDEGNYLDELLIHSGLGYSLGNASPYEDDTYIDLPYYAIRSHEPWGGTLDDIKRLFCDVEIIEYNDFFNFDESDITDLVVGIDSII